MIDIVDIVLIVLFVWSIINVMRTRNINLHLQEYITIVKVQYEDEQCYVWNASTEEFISQGKDLNEAMEKALLRFPNTKFVFEEQNETTH